MADGRTDGLSDKQNYDLQDRASTGASCGNDDDDDVAIIMIIAKTFS